MNVIVQNQNMTVNGATPEAIRFAASTFSYTDKAKQYQIKRMSNNPWQRNSPLFAQLQKEVEGKLYELDTATNTLTFSSSFFSSFMAEFESQVILTDKRTETGKTVALPWVTKPFAPRPYQEEAIDLLLNNHRGIINLATGLGKTLIATHMVKQYRKRTLVVCPSDSVARQFYDIFVNVFGKHKVGFYGGGKKQMNEITVGIAASICKNVDAFKAHDLGLVIFDEVHHIAANTFFVIAEGLTGVGKVFGLTATDFRSDGKDIMINAGVGPVLIKRDVKWGVENGFLAEPYFIIKTVDTHGHDYAQDKLKAYKEHILNNQLMKDTILADCQKMMAAGKFVLCLVDEVAHGRELAAQLGVPFATGEDSNSNDYVNQLNAGTIQALVGTDGKISEGTDTKNVDVLILANFTASKGPVIQAVGRALRKQGTKTKAIIVDYIPKGSSMLTRHALKRVEFYREITDHVKVI